MADTPRDISTHIEGQLPRFQRPKTILTARFESAVTHRKHKENEPSEWITESESETIPGECGVRGKRSGQIIGLPQFHKPETVLTARSNTAVARHRHGESIRRERISEAESGILRRAFYAQYPPPPSNMAAAGRYELKYKRQMPPGLPEALWERHLKPWSIRWYELYQMFYRMIQAKKRLRPLSRSTDVTKGQCMRWAARFRDVHGDPSPISSQSKTASARAVAYVEKSVR